MTTGKAKNFIFHIIFIIIIIIVVVVVVVNFCEEFITWVQILIAFHLSDITSKFAPLTYLSCLT
jgi:hypothetical protein